MDTAPLVGLITFAGLPGLTPDDRLLVDALADRGIGSEPAVWSDPAIRWERFAAVVFRSCWDYHKRYAEFEAWLDRLAAAGVVTCNALPLARWNAGKGYLLDLAARGLPVVPTTRLERRDDWTIQAVRAAAGARAVVVKPIVSATAWLTWRLDASMPSLPDACRDTLAARDCIVQPFVPEIVHGEWSLVFFDRVFSHAVVKRPIPGEFRVQEEYGGIASPERPPARLLDEARRILDAVEGPVVYARVDGVDTRDGFRLLELELLEPALYLARSPEAPRRFADAVARQLAASAATPRPWHV
jgi:glutathione synthase/RimK-type ligase-like ATP-grasp enzyme